MSWHIYILYIILCFDVKLYQIYYYRRAFTPNRKLLEYFETINLYIEVLYER